jgi:hypothetical protein
MPLSEKQLAANRANARKSRGPITPATRRNCSRNAIQHGIFAQTILLPGESRRRFLRLLADLTSEFHATTPNELALVETMAFRRWRTLRNWTFQADSAPHEDPPAPETKKRRNDPTYLHENKQNQRQSDPNRPLNDPRTTPERPANDPRSTRALSQ